MNREPSENRGGYWLLVGVALSLPSLVTLAYFVWLRSFPSSVQQLAYAVGKSLQFLLPVLWVGWLAKRVSVSPRSTRLAGSKQRREAVVWGLVFGALVAVAMLCLYCLGLEGSEFMAGPGEQVRKKVAELGIGSPLKFAAVGVFYSLVHSGLEEYYWRWFVFAELRRERGFVWSTIVSSLGFMAHHIILLSVYFGIESPATYVFSLGVAVGGAFWAWLYERTGSLVAPWLSHLLVDAGIFLLGAQLVFGA